MNPNRAMENAVQEPVKSLISYYTTCAGSNPLLGETANTTHFFTELTISITNLTTNIYLCPRNANLLETKTLLGTMASDIDKLVAHTNCDDYASAWIKFMYKGMLADILYQQYNYVATIHNYYHTTL